MKRCVDAFFDVLQLGPDGKTSHAVGRACLCWQCGHVGIPTNIDKCARGIKVAGVCANPACASDAATNFVRPVRPGGDVVPWIELKARASQEAVKAAANQERQMEQQRGGKRDGPAQPKKASRVGRNAPCPCGSGKKYKKCCGKRKSAS